MVAPLALLDSHGTVIPPEDLALVWTMCGVATDALIRHVADPTVAIGNKPLFVLHLAHRVAHNCACLRMFRVSTATAPPLAKGNNAAPLSTALRCVGALVPRVPWLPWFYFSALRVLLQGCTAQHCVRGRGVQVFRSDTRAKSGTKPFVCVHSGRLDDVGSFR